MTNETDHSSILVLEARFYDPIDKHGATDHLPFTDRNRHLADLLTSKCPTYFTSQSPIVRANWINSRLLKGMSQSPLYWMYTGTRSPFTTAFRTLMRMSKSRKSDRWRMWYSRAITWLLA